MVTGAGCAFCAGADLGNLQTATRESLGNVYEGFLRVARSPLPTLAAVNGAAVGAGMNLALGCDVRIASTRARFDTRFLQIGLHPGGGHTWMQLRTVGLQAAMAAVVFGQVLDGAEAERVGLVYRCVADDELLEQAQAFAARGGVGATRAGDRHQADDPRHGRRRDPRCRRRPRARAAALERATAVVRRADRGPQGADLEQTAERPRRERAHEHAMDEIAQDCYRRLYRAPGRHRLSFAQGESYTPRNSPSHEGSGHILGLHGGRGPTRR